MRVANGARRAILGRVENIPDGRPGRKPVPTRRVLEADGERLLVLFDRP
jgi:hypothetical protein